MQRIWKIVITIAVLPGILHVASRAQFSQPNYTRAVWQVKDGLPEDVVQAFAQTPDHYLWIGTTAGLVQFDGKAFITYDHRNVPALRENSIFCLLTARDGGLWIGTEGGGLVLYKNGVFRLFSVADGLMNGFIRTVKQDDQGRLWIGTDGGLFRMAGNIVKRVDGTGNVPSLVVHAILQDNEGRIWAGGSRVLRFDHDNATEYRLKGELSQYRVKSILVARDGTTWVGTVSGLYSLDAQDTNSRRTFNKVKGISGTVRTLRQDADGSIWAGTIGEGIYIFQGGKQTRLQSPDWLPSNTVLYFFQDTEKNLWIGTQHGMLRLSETSVRTIPLPGAVDSDFGTVYLDVNGDLWMGSDRLFRIRNGVAHQYDFPGVAGARVRNVFRDRENRLWLGTDGSGIFRIAGGKVDHFTVEDGLENNFIRAFLQSRDGSLWIATDDGLSRWFHGAFTSYRIADGLAYSNQRCLFEDAQGDIWIGTEHGLSRMHLGLFMHDAVTARLKDEKIWSIHQDREGGLWFGTRTNGLYLWKSGAMTHFTTAQGLVSDSIYQILEDNNDRFWMSGPAGVSLVKRSELTRTAADPTHRLAVKLFGISQRIEMTQIYGGTQSAGVLTSDGVWFPSGRGPVHLSAPGDLREEPPPVVIDKVMVDGTEHPPGDIVLKPGSKKIQLSYTAVSLRSPEDIRFRYKLDGFDQGWTSSEGQRQVYYTNLSPGHYRFRVVAFNTDEPEKTSQASLAIQQNPYFYRTSWFMLLCFFSLGALVWFSHLRRLRQVRLRFDAVLEERGRVAREMHDTLIQGCVSVSTLLEGVLSQDEAACEERSRLLNCTRNQLRLTLDEARRALWNLRRDETLATEIAPLLTSLADEIAKEAKRTISCETAGLQYPIRTAQARELLMITREALYNAVHHSDSTMIKLQIEFSRDGLDVRVADNGKGFDPHEVMAARFPGHYGLIGIRERVERMKGAFILTSKPGSGTQLCFKIPCKPLRVSRGDASK